LPPKIATLRGCDVLGPSFFTVNVFVSRKVWKVHWTGEVDKHAPGPPLHGLAGGGGGFVGLQAPMTPRLAAATTDATAYRRHPAVRKFCIGCLSFPQEEEALPPNALLGFMSRASFASARLSNGPTASDSTSRTRATASGSTPSSRRRKAIA
jgi:hypothetical protein